MVPAIQMWNPDYVASTSGFEPFGLDKPSPPSSPIPLVKRLSFTRRESKVTPVDPHLLTQNSRLSLPGGRDSGSAYDDGEGNHSIGNPIESV